MAGEMDKIKGTLKRAAGKATGNEKLKTEGAIDITAGKVKDYFEKTTHRRDK